MNFKYLHINIIIEMPWQVCNKNNFILRCHNLFLNRECKSSINSSVSTLTDICVDTMDLDRQKSLRSIQIHNK